jgi:hypothetical protein
MDWGRRRFESAASGTGGGGINWAGLGPGNISSRFSVGGAARNEGGQFPLGAPEIFPTVAIVPSPRAVTVEHPEPLRDTAVVYEGEVIEPREAVQETVFEGGYGLPQSVVPVPRYRVPPRSVLDPIPIPVDTTVVYSSGEGPVPAFDWGDFAGNVLGGIAGGIFDPVGLGSGVRGLVAGPASMPGAYSTPAAGQPRTVTVDTVTGRVTPCRRRRRRRLLTSSDLSDLAALKSIIGGGAGLNSAVVKAVRR